MHLLLTKLLLNTKNHHKKNILVLMSGIKTRLKSVLRSKWTARICLGLILLIVLAGLGYKGTKILSGPAEGIVTQNVERTEAEQKIVMTKDLVNSYFSAKYAGRYELQTNTNKSASLQSWLLVARQAAGAVPAGIISITIVYLPTGGVKEDSAYKQFEAFKDIYTLSKRTYSAEEVVVADRTETNFEHTALWAHGGYLLTASMTSNQKNELLLSEFDAILDSLKWK